MCKTVPTLGNVVGPMTSKVHMYVFKTQIGFSSLQVAVMYLVESKIDRPIGGPIKPSGGDT